MVVCYELKTSHGLRFAMIQAGSAPNDSGARAFVPFFDLNPHLAGLAHAPHAQDAVEPHLVADGHVVLPARVVADSYEFRVALPVRHLRLMSGSGRPAEVKESSDWRRLGVAVFGLQWSQPGRSMSIPLSSLRFMDGFHEVEDGAFRWTNGSGGLPVPDWHGEARLHLTLQEWEASRTPPRISEEQAVLGAFESLGERCELALVQRHFDVELPLSLLRWAGTDYRRLTAGLLNRFDGLGDPGTTEVTPSGDDYRLETPYMRMHTWQNVARSQIDVDDIHAAGCATLRLLRRKLLDDIARDRRFFVFATADEAFGESEMHALHRAMRRIGPARLLCVTLARPECEAMQIRILSDNLYWAALDRFVGDQGPYDAWYGLCAGVLALHGSC